jgi:hypothetical protein
MKIEELESKVEEGLSKLRSPEFQPLDIEPLAPKGYRVHVSLTDKKGRKKRKDASADNWSPESGEIRISFEPATESVVASGEAIKQESTPTSDPVSDLVRALDRAESRPGYQFVALKWFRDVFLPGEGFAWARSEASRQNVLREAIERRLILTSKVPNPKTPQFPVTAIRLNRLYEDTQALLGKGGVSNSEFDPVEIRGESLSTTVLRERR